MYSENREWLLKRIAKTSDIEYSELKDIIYNCPLFHSKFIEWTLSYYDPSKMPYVDSEGVFCRDTGEDYVSYTVKSTTNKTKVMQFTKDGVYVNTFNTIAQATKVTPARYKPLSDCLYRNGKTAGGFVWKLEE